MLEDVVRYAGRPHYQLIEAVKCGTFKCSDACRVGMIRGQPLSVVNIEVTQKNDLREWRRG